MQGILKIQTISPIVIREGGHTINYYIDYIPIGNRVFVIKKEKLLKKLMEKGLLERYISILDEAVKTQDISILKKFFVTENLCDETFLSAVSMYVLNSNINLEETQFRQIGYFIRDSYMRPYIPGSSIKGALRTALLYNLIIEDPDHVKHVNSVLNEVIKDKRADIRKVDDKLEERYLRGTYYTVMKKRGREIKKLVPGPHRDIFRGIMISDGSPFANEDILVSKVLLKESDEERELTLVEMLKAGVTSVHHIKVDEYFTEVIAHIMELKNRINLSGDIPRILNNFYIEVLKEEKAFAEEENILQLVNFYSRLEKALTNNRFLIRIGWGSGWLSTTIGLILRREMPDLLEKLRLKYKMGIPGKPFPLSRKLTIDYQPLGWCLGDISWRT